MKRYLQISKKKIAILVVLILGISIWGYPILSDIGSSEDFEVNKVLFEVSENKSMEALLYIPEGEGPFPLVYFGAGSGADPVQYSYYGKSFAENGFLTFIHGPTKESTSFPSKVHWEIRNDKSLLFNRSLEEDLEVISQLKERPDVDINRIIVAGHSGGANSAYRVAVEEKDVTAVIAIAGRYPPDDVDKIDTNLLLATGKKDSLVPQEKLEEIAYDVTGKNISDGEVSGNFEDDNATKIFVSESSGHLTEANDEDLIEESVEWALSSVGEERSVEIETKSYTTMLIQLFSGLAALFCFLLLIEYSECALLEKYEFIIPLCAFSILFLILYSTVSAQFIQLGPVGYRWFQYLLIGIVGSISGISVHTFAERYQLEGEYKELGFDLIFLLGNGAIFILVSTQFVIFQLVTSVVLGSLLFMFLFVISLVLLKTDGDLRQRLCFDMLALIWLLPVLVPPYTV